MSNPFSYRSRIGRIEFLIILTLYVSWIIIYLAIQAHALAKAGKGEFDDGLLPWVIMIIATWIMITSTSKRLHDLNRNGWWQLFGYLFPFAQILFLPYLLFWKGNDDYNDYGDVPVEIVFNKRNLKTYFEKIKWNLFFTLLTVSFIVSLILYLIKFNDWLGGWGLLLALVLNIFGYILFPFINWWVEEFNLGIFLIFGIFWICAGIIAFIERKKK